MVGCAVFAVSYSNRVLSGFQAARKLDVARQSVAEQRDWQGQITRMIDEADSPAAVEDFARNQQNLARPDDKTVITMPGKSAEPGVIQQVGERQLPLPPDAAEPNWKLWWKLIAPPSRGP